MKLRKLLKGDAPLMLEWMHDEDVVQYMKVDFKRKTIEDCISFINASDTNNIHFAIASDENEYMGTVSLKNITLKSAELGITVRKKAMGKGYSAFAIEEIMKYGFIIKGIENIYWYVDPSNARALHFYDKNGYLRVKPSQIASVTKHQEADMDRYIWYLVKSI